MKIGDRVYITVTDSWGVLREIKGSEVVVHVMGSSRDNPHKLLCDRSNVVAVPEEVV